MHMCQQLPPLCVAVAWPCCGIPMIALQALQVVQCVGNVLHARLPPPIQSASQRRRHATALSIADAEVCLRHSMTLRCSSHQPPECLMELGSLAIDGAKQSSKESHAQLVLRCGMATAGGCAQPTLRVFQLAIAELLAAELRLGVWISTGSCLRQPIHCFSWFLRLQL